MTQRKDNYRAALKRDAGARGGNGIVIRTRPVCLTIDLAPGLQRSLDRIGGHPAMRLATLGASMTAQAVGRRADRVRKLF
jgi:hypothetical protein